MLAIRSSVGKVSPEALAADGVLDALIEVVDASDVFDELVAVDGKVVTVLARRARTVGAARIRGWTLTEEGRTYDARRPDESGPRPVVAG